MLWLPIPDASRQFSAFLLTSRDAYFMSDDLGATAPSLSILSVGILSP